MRASATRGSEVVELEPAGAAILTAEVDERCGDGAHESRTLIFLERGEVELILTSGSGDNHDYAT